MIHCSKDELFAEQVYFLYGYVNLAGPKARVRYSHTRHDLSRVLILVYRTRHRETTIGGGGGLDLRLLSGTAHIFGSPRDTRGG